MSDRSIKPSFAVSRNLKNAKYHFIEANIDDLAESSDITDSDTTQAGPALAGAGPYATPRRGAPLNQWCCDVIVLSQPCYDLFD